MASQQPQYEEEEKKSPGKIIIIVLIAIWVILGIAGFIMSIVCFGKSGSTSQHVIGLLLAILFGNFLISLSEIKKLRHYKFANRIYMFLFIGFFILQFRTIVNAYFHKLVKRLKIYDIFYYNVS